MVLNRHKLRIRVKYGKNESKIYTICLQGFNFYGTSTNLHVNVFIIKKRKRFFSSRLILCFIIFVILLKFFSIVAIVSMESFVKNEGKFQWNIFVKRHILRLLESFTSNDKTFTSLTNMKKWCRTSKMNNLTFLYRALYSMLKHYFY